MTLLVQGRITGMILLIIIISITIYLLQQAKTGKTRNIRSLPAFEGIKTGIQRSVEMGKPVFFTTAMGGGGIYSDKGTAHMAGISILGYSARLAADLGAELIMITPYAEMVPVAEDTIKEAYIMEGHPEEYSADMVRYLSGYSHTFKMAYVGLMARERPGVSILAGPLWSSDALQMTEPGAQLGVMQIGGADNMTSLSMLALTCDYLLIGEELYSAAAFSSQDPFQLNVIYALDLFKVGLIALIIIGYILSNVGVDLSPIFNF
jgi:hypothetical protein